MKKFLSVLLEVLMVLSTVSFAAPSLADVADTAVEAPVSEVPAEEAAEEAELMVMHEANYGFSLEFDSAADLGAISMRTAKNDALGAANMATVDDGALVLTFDAADAQYAVRDSGFNMPKVLADANKITAFEMRVKFTGLPEAGTIIKGDDNATRNFNPENFNALQIYPNLDGGTFVGDGQNYMYSFTNDEWQVIRYTPDQLGMTDRQVTGFRIDPFDYMPEGSKLYIDYIRFEGDNYETLSKYDVEFDTADDIGSKARIVTNNGVQNVSWNEEGYMTIKSVPIDGYEATWDQQIYVDTVSPATALPAGVVDEIVVRMRFRNLPTETKEYTVSGRNTTALNPAKMPGYVHIDEYGATKWMEKLQSNNKYYENVVDGQWFERRLDAETYFPGGMAYVRLDLPYPIPAGVEVDVDYIRFVGDNSKVPASEWEGDYGELVLEIDFEDLEVGKPGTAFTYDMQSGGAAAGNFIANYGGKVNPGFACSNANIYFRNESGLSDIEIKEDAEHGKYVSYTITSNGASKNVWDLNTYNSIYKFSSKDGYFVLTYDYLSPKDGGVIRAHWNRSHQAEDTIKTEGKYTDAVANKWTKMVEIYDNSTIGTSSHNPPVASITELDHILLYQQSQQVGETYAIDNVRLWWVPKTVKVQVSGDGYFYEAEVSPTMKVSEFMSILPELGTKSVIGLSKTDGGELLDEDGILGLTYTTTLYAELDEIETLEGSNEYNTAADLDMVYTSWAQARLGRNNAKTTAAAQFALGSDDTASYLVMENEAANGETGCVVDYGYIVTATPFSRETVKEIVVKMRVKGLPETTTAYKCGGTHGTCTADSTHSIDPTNCNYVEFVYWDADSAGVKQDYRRMNLKGNEDWFTVTIPASEFPYDNIKQFRLDPFGDYAPHGSSVEIDYIRFMPYPEPELDVLAYSAEFNENAKGVSLTSWRKEDGTFMVDDGVNGDKGPGIGSKYLTDGAEGYITWNEEGYVTLNFDANNEIIGDASDRGYTPAVYDPSIYVAALDGAKSLPAGAFDELVIRMRLRNFPADGTEIYGQNYGGLTSATYNFAQYPVYFHYDNNPDSVLYAGAKSKHVDASVEFTKGSFARDEWFEVTIPASFFEADVNPLATLRINLPDWTPDGAKVDIDYIRFMGTAPDAEAPVTSETTELRQADADHSNAIRFKASVVNTTADAATDIGWLVSTASYLEDNGYGYEDLSMDLVNGGKVKVAYQRENSEDLVKFFDTTDDTAPVFAAFLHNIPAKNALNNVVVRSFVNVNGTYLYSNPITANLYDLAIAPYVEFTGDGTQDIYELVESGYTYDEAIDYDFVYNAAYNALDDEQKAYVVEVLRAILG